MVEVVHQNCEPADADNKSLPLNSFIVEYKVDEKMCYDIVVSHKPAAIFDLYWDMYRSDLIGFKWTKGKVNPRLWKNPNKAKSKTK